MKGYKFRVDIVESERGWGQRLDESKLFDTYEEAAAFVAEFNAKNTEEQVPDWYMFARAPVAVLEKFDPPEPSW